MKFRREDVVGTHLWDRRNGPIGGIRNSRDPKEGFIETVSDVNGCAATAAEISDAAA